MWDQEQSPLFSSLLSSPMNHFQTNALMAYLWSITVLFIYFKSSRLLTKFNLHSSSAPRSSLIRHQSTVSPGTPSYTAPPSPHHSGSMQIRLILQLPSFCSTHSTALQLWDLASENTEWPLKLGFQIKHEFFPYNVSCKISIYLAILSSTPNNTMQNQTLMSHSNVPSIRKPSFFPHLSKVYSFLSSVSKYLLC